MKEFDIVVAAKNLDEGRVPEGSAGTVIDVYSNPEGYEVEFEVPGGWAAVSCYPSDIFPKHDALRQAI